MTTARFTVRLDEEQAAWVEAEAEARERSQAWILREAVDLARGADSRLSAPNRSDSVRIGAHRTGVNRTDATDSPALETGEETAPATDAGDDIDDSDDRGDTDGLALEEQGDVIETVVGDVTESWGDSGPRLEDRRDAARAVLRLLFERGQVSKQLAIDELLPGYEVSGQTAETWWRQNCRDVVRELATYSNGEHAYVLDEQYRPPGKA
jgi:hypothetical protein